MATATPTVVHYPSGDGKPMAETWLHVRAIMWLHQALEDFFHESAGRVHRVGHLLVLGRG